jgi:putative transposase
MVAEVMTTHHLSQRRACGLMGSRGAVFGGRREKIAIAYYVSGCASWPRSGAAGAVRCSICLLRREGSKANHKRVERLYREEGLSLRRRRRRKRLSHLRVMRAQPLAADQTWAVDFIQDSLFNGRRFRAFAVLDE